MAPPVADLQGDWGNHTALANVGGHVVMPEAGAGTEGHGLLGPSIAPCYAQAVAGSRAGCTAWP